MDEIKLLLVIIIVAAAVLPASVVILMAQEAEGFNQKQVFGEGPPPLTICGSAYMLTQQWTGNNYFCYSF